MHRGLIYFAILGLYYAGYGVLLMPSMGITNAYGWQTTEFYNAFGFYLLGLSTTLSTRPYDSVTQ
jgi:hypothetical protein